MQGQRGSVLKLDLQGKPPWKGDLKERPAGGEEGMTWRPGAGHWSQRKQCRGPRQAQVCAGGSGVSVGHVKTK